MGYLYLMMGCIISSAVIPATLTLIWKGQNKWAASLSPIFGLAFALIAWLVTARKECGALDVACTGSNNPMLAGNVVALLSPLVLIPIFTLIFGMDNYDWKSMMAIRRGDDHELAATAGIDLEQTAAGHVETTNELAEEQAKLTRASKISKWTTVGLTISFLVLWPFHMYGSSYVFSKPFFIGWITVGIIWIFCSLGAVGLFPVFEGRQTLARTFKAIAFDLSGKKSIRVIRAENEATTIDGKTASGTETPPNVKDPVKTETGEKAE
ncbi:hypothetical protein PC116_g28658 [Phytophthora cactorum]|nr:hypothetical protein PC116_g28658 [Phytophthora cactorum]